MLMTPMRSSIAALTSVALLAGSSLAFAQPHHDSHHPGPAAHPGPANHAAPERRAAEENHKAAEQHKWGEAEKKKAEAWRNKYQAEQARTRAQRRAQQIAAERKQWNQAMLGHAEVKREMELDAWRLARIQALRALAVEENRQDLIPRLDALRAREMARHNHLMGGYRTRWGH
jgi:hypothetical protein